MHVIEFCVSNMHHGTDRLLTKLSELPDVEVIEYGCLGNCGECYLFPFAMVNGETVAAETVDELYEVIQAEMKKQEAERSALDKLLDDL